MKKNQMMMMEDEKQYKGLSKAEKREFIIKKYTEIGAKRFAPVIMERCIVKFDKKI